MTETSRFEAVDLNICLLVPVSKPVVLSTVTRKEIPWILVNLELRS